MKKIRNNSSIAILILSILFVLLFSSVAAASSRITVPLDDTELMLSPANPEEQKAIDELYGKDISAGELIRKAFPSFIPILNAEQLKQMDNARVDWSKYYYFSGEDDVSSDYVLQQLGLISNLNSTTSPNNPLSRAEFAKITVYMAGKQRLAEDMSKANGNFQDVKPEDWFNGYVNVAAAEGWMKGDYSGNFSPKREITQSEVVTVLLRILGYNDNLPGKWPANYIGKAAMLNMLDDSKLSFLANKEASCEVVSILCNAAFEQYMVNYDPTLNTFEKALKVEADIIGNEDQQKVVPYTLRQKIMTTGQL